MRQNAASSLFAARRAVCARGVQECCEGAGQFALPAALGYAGPLEEERCDVKRGVENRRKGEER